jgi:5'-deoxynucleotidase
MSSKFVAWLLRLRNVSRWPLQKNLSPTNVGEHIFETAVIGHMIGSIDKFIYKNDATNPDYITSLCLFHESAECIGGDVNSKAKNYDEETKLAFSILERKFEQKLLDTLPIELLAFYKPLVMQDKSLRMVDLAKASDVINAYHETLTEIRLGNNEFLHASIEIKKKLDVYTEKYQSVNYFMENMFPCFVDSYDQLSSNE